MEWRSCGKDKIRRQSYKSSKHVSSRLLRMHAKHGYSGEQMKIESQPSKTSAIERSFESDGYNGKRMSDRAELNVAPNRLLQYVRRQKLSYFGHIWRHKGLEKSVLEAYIPGRRRRGRPRYRWEKTIIDAFGSMTRAGRTVSDRTLFRKAVRAATLWREYAETTTIAALAYYGIITTSSNALVCPIC